MTLFQLMRIWNRFVTISRDTNYVFGGLVLSFTTCEKVLLHVCCVPEQKKRIGCFGKGERWMLDGVSMMFSVFMCSFMYALMYVYT
jgi:hypothetical protein